MFGAPLCIGSAFLGQEPSFTGLVAEETMSKPSFPEACNVCPEDQNVCFPGRRLKQVSEPFSALIPKFPMVAALDFFSFQGGI